MFLQDGKLLYSFAYINKMFGFEFWMLEMACDKGWLRDTYFREQDRSALQTYVTFDDFWAFCDSPEFWEFLHERQRQELLEAKRVKTNRRIK